MHGLVKSLLATLPVETDIVTMFFGLHQLLFTFGRCFCLSVCLLLCLWA